MLVSTIFNSNVSTDKSIVAGDVHIRSSESTISGAKCEFSFNAGSPCRPIPIVLP